jgi:hypothetical protein
MMPNRIDRPFLRLSVVVIAAMGGVRETDRFEKRERLIDSAAIRNLYLTLSGLAILPASGAGI